MIWGIGDFFCKRSTISDVSIELLIFLLISLSLMIFLQNLIEALGFY